MSEPEKQGSEAQKREHASQAASNEAAERESAALRARLDRLSADLDAGKDSRPASGATDASVSAASVGSAMSLGFRVLTEFVSAVVVGALVGWQLDKWFGTGPLFLLVLVLLGTAAGFWNVYRIAVKRPGSKS